MSPKHRYFHQYLPPAYLGSANVGVWENDYRKYTCMYYMISLNQNVQKMWLGWDSSPDSWIICWKHWLTAICNPPQMQFVFWCVGETEEMKTFLPTFALSTTSPLPPIAQVSRRLQNYKLFSTVTSLNGHTNFFDEIPEINSLLTPLPSPPPPPPPHTHPQKSDINGHILLQEVSKENKRENMPHKKAVQQLKWSVNIHVWDFPVVGWTQKGNTFTQTRTDQSNTMQSADTALGSYST